MLQPWNDSTILPPPVNMFKCLKKIDVSLLKHVCNTISKVLSKQSPLHIESALCSRFLYKYDKKFRNDIGYRNFKKVHTALKKYLALNLLKDIEYFRMSLPTESDDEKYLPSRQMLEYVMLRIITFSMIMLRICVCSKQAAIFYLDRVKRAESHWMCLLPYALLSRLWSISMVLVQHSTTWYSNLYPYLNKLEPKGLTFLPEGYVLPEDLEVWLDLKNIDNFGRFNWDYKRSPDLANILDDEDDSDLFDSILNFVNNSTKAESDVEVDEEMKPILDKCIDEISSIVARTNIDQGKILSRANFNMDQGEVISRDKLNKEKGEALSRESFKLLLKTHNKITKDEKQYSNDVKTNTNLCKEKSHKIEKQSVDLNINKKPITKENKDHSHKNITNTISLKNFINREESYRNEGDSKSLTKHLSLMQWHALKKVVLKLCDTLTDKNVERKFQRIWKDRCLNYK